MKITDIKPQRKGKNRFNIFVDGEYALGLSANAYEAARIYVGQELTVSELERLTNVDRTCQAMDRARTYLATRPRSESEIRNRMKRYGYDEEIVHSVVDHLVKSGLIDDYAFATFWKENRTEFKPRSSRMLTSELRQKGIDRETAALAVSGIDDANEALRAAIPKARSLSGYDYKEFRRKLGAFLQRRGFDWNVINSTTEHLWNEKTK